MASFSSSHEFSNEDALISFGSQLANSLSGRHTILLNGPVGAGKSVLARSIIAQCLEAPEDIPSPTFTLVQTYETDAFDILHCDLYRLKTPDQCFELGLDDAFGTSLCLIEWPDRLGPYAPKDALHVEIQLAQNPNARIVVFTYSDPSWSPILDVASAAL